MQDDRLLVDRPEAIPELAARLLRLRDQYVMATPRQRLAKARQRIQNASAYPNQLVTHVSAVEAVARSLLMHERARGAEQLKVVYQRLKNREAHTLVVEYLQAKGVQDVPTYIGCEDWVRFRHAVNYRNLLVHECTYLGVEKFEELVKGCNAVLSKLELVSGLEPGAA